MIVWLVQLRGLQMLQNLLSTLIPSHQVILKINDLCFLIKYKHSKSFQCFHGSLVKEWLLKVSHQVTELGSQNPPKQTISNFLKQSMCCS